MISDGKLFHMLAILQEKKLALALQCTGYLKTLY